MHSRYPTAVVRPGTAGRAVLNQEPGTLQRDKTGTAAWQQAPAA